MFSKVTYTLLIVGIYVYIDNMIKIMILPESVVLNQFDFIIYYRAIATYANSVGAILNSFKSYAFPWQPSVNLPY